MQKPLIAPTRMSMAYAPLACITFHARLPIVTVPARTSPTAAFALYAWPWIQTAIQIHTAPTRTAPGARR